MPKVHRAVVAFSVIALLLAALLALAYLVPAPAVVSAQDGLRHTLRVYGRWNYGAGDQEGGGTIPGGGTVPPVVDPEIIDHPVTGDPAKPEDPPYTVPDPIFNPQLEQAPIKDSITSNPLFMSEFETFDENHALGLYQKIFAGSLNATEKVWFRMWYEPTHWDKDLNANGELDIRDALRETPYPPGERDEWYPAVMQEFTYMLMEADLLVNEPEPLAGQVGRTSFVFPVGMRKGDLFTSGGAIDTASPNARYGYGLTSLDGDFDGVPDIVHVESELTLFATTRIAADFDGDGVIEPLDLDDIQLNGNELAVFRLETKPRGVGQAVQFLDHLVVVKAVFEDSALLDVWYTGDMVPVYLGSRTIFVGDMLLSGNSGPGQRIPANGTNVCDFPTGPWFVFLESIDVGEDQARLMVGRALGASWSAMEDAPNQLDLRPGDPWFLKRFYVDGHEYNVVALKTRYGTNNVVFDPAGCSLSPGDWPPEVDPTEFKFITIRTPIPKEGTYDDPLAGYLIEQHSVRLQPYPAETELSVMPPFNYEHYIILDVQAIDAFTCEEGDVHYFGPLVGPVPPILQQNGPFPYQGVGSYSPYTDRNEMSLLYSEEDKNQQFLGELKEKYGESQTAQFWYVEQFRTVPYEYTEFVLPDLNPAHIGGRRDLYLLTSSFWAPQSEYILWRQDIITQTFNLTWDDELECWVRDYPSSDMPDEWRPRVKFWFDPGVGGKKYKDSQGIRVYGFDSEGPGAEVTDRINDAYPVEVWPYTDPQAPFNPQLPEAPPKDSLTFNPAYMNEFIHSNESLVSLYRQISIREQNAYEKVFLRMWYEPEYLDKIRIEDSDEYVFPALMQEFTYMYLDTRDQPASAQPKSSSFAFPMATAAGQLPAPDPVTHALPASQLPSFGWGLTSFDANFDGQHDIVHLHSENSLSTITGIDADFDGDGQLDLLDEDVTPLNGNEMVVFALEDMVLRRGDSVQFLDHMVTLDNVSTDRADLQLWYTGGGLHSVTGGYSLHPDRIGSYSMRTAEMAIARRSAVRVLPAGGGNLGSVDGAWFVFVNAINPGNETVSLLVGRALGAAHSAIDNGNGAHDLANGDPWYLKRFFVDGHEYNVVAVHVVPATATNPGDERYEFKYITIRTPVPKENFINFEDSQKLEGYYRGTVWGVDTSVISLMPPFNFPHTGMEDIQALPERDPVTGDIVFRNPDFFDEDCHGDVIKDLPPYQIRIVDEDQEPQFFGELKEKYWEAVDASGIRDELWQTEQWHIVPDEYTELQLPRGQKYLLTSAWVSDQMEVNFYRCGGGETVGGSAGLSQQQDGTDRVKFWYDPSDPKDIYINTWQGPGPGPTPTPSPTPPPGATGTIRGRVLLQGRTDYSGAVVTAAGVSGVTDATGYFTLSNVPAGTHDVRAEMPGYLDHVKTGVVLVPDGLNLLPDVQLLGGDADNNCLVNVFDLVIVAWNYDSSPPTDPRADINGNNKVDIFDLVMVGANLDQACPGPWAAPSMVAPQALAPAHLRVWPADPLMAPLGGLVKVTLEIEDVQDLYGADVHLSFDPDMLEVVDVDPVAPGVQIDRGDLPDPAQGAVAAEEADNVTGMVRYAITLKSPASPASGNGTLCAITFRAKAVGSSALAIQAAELLDPQAAEIEVITHDGEVQVGDDYALIYLPIVFKPAER